MPSSTGQFQHRTEQGEREQGGQEGQVIPNRELLPKQVMIRDEKHEQQDSKSYCRRTAPVCDPRSDKSAANRSQRPEGEPDQLHPKGKIESGFCLMIVRPPCSEGKIYNGGDQDPGDEPNNNGSDHFHGHGICGGMGKRAFHISLIVIL